MYCNISDCNCCIMAMGYSNGPTHICCAYDVFIYGEKSENSEKSKQKTGQCVPGQARGQCVQHTVYRNYTLLDHSKWRRLPESEQLVRSLQRRRSVEYFYANDLFCLAPRKEQGCQGRSRRKQPALCIEGHNRVPSLVNHVLMRFDAFRMEVIEIRWAGPLGPRHASF